MKANERVSAIYQPKDPANAPAVYAPFVGQRGYFVAYQQDPISKVWSLWPETFCLQVWSDVRVPQSDLADVRTIHPTPNGLKPMRQRT